MGGFDRVLRQITLTSSVPHSFERWDSFLQRMVPEDERRHYKRAYGTIVGKEHEAPVYRMVITGVVPCFDIDMAGVERRKALFERLGLGKVEEVLVPLTDDAWVTCGN